MRALIEVESQAEFDEKRPYLIKALQGGKPPSEAREPEIVAQRQMLALWNSSFNAMIGELKDEISSILE